MENMAYSQRKKAGIARLLLYTQATKGPRGDYNIPDATLLYRDYRKLAFISPRLADLICSSFVWMILFCSFFYNNYI